MAKTLSEYLTETGETQESFARRLGTTQASVSRWCRGGIPKNHQIPAIADLTGGAVPPAVWFSSEARKTPEAPSTETLTAGSPTGG